MPASMRSSRASVGGTSGRPSPGWRASSAACASSQLTVSLKSGSASLSTESGISGGQHDPDGADGGAAKGRDIGRMLAGPAGNDDVDVLRPRCHRIVVVDRNVAGAGIAFLVLFR